MTQRVAPPVRIEVRHSTTYRYAAPLKSGLQYIRLTPMDGPSQRVVAWELSAPGRLLPWRDHHGNACHSLAVTGKRQDLQLRAVGLVETEDTVGVLPEARGGLPAAAYLRSSPLTLSSPALAELAERHRQAMAADRLNGLHRVMGAVAAAVAYREGETEVTTTAADALARGQGVCQDHAHVFIACCRLLHIPARYVSGYLATLDGSTASHGAGHGWAEALVPDIGWVSFDPANRVCAGAHYLRLAIGFDYLDASPLRGVRRGGGSEALQVQIEIQGQN